MAGSLSNNGFKILIGIGLWIVSIHSPLFAQNLVLNPSFEEYWQCPEKASSFNGFVKDWTTFFSSPNYGYVGCYDFIYRDILPVNGSGYVFLVYSHSDLFPREYIHGTFSKPLIRDSLYYIEYYVHKTRYGVAVKNYQAYLSASYMDSIPADGTYLGLEPSIEYVSSDFIVYDSGWVKVADCYLAEGGEQHIMIGLFQSDIEIEGLVITGGSYGNLIVDQVGVFPMSELRYRADELIYVGDTLHFTAEDPRHYYDDVGRIAYFTSNDTGCYTLHYRLKNCDMRDSFQVCVEGCPEVDSIDLFGTGQHVYCQDTGELRYFHMPDSSYVTYIDGIAYNEAFSWDDLGIGQHSIEIHARECPNRYTDRYDYIVAPCCDSTHTVQVDCPQMPDTTTQDTTIIIIDSMSLCHIYIPNAFSPNDDGINDLWRPYADCSELLDYNLQVYNRYGGRVWESRDLRIGWQGDCITEACPEAYYVYKLQYRDQGELHILTGDVLLTR